MNAFIVVLLLPCAPSILALKLTVIACNHVTLIYLVSSDNKELKAMLLSFGLKQLIKDPTRVTQDSKTLIDVIYTNRPQNVYSVKVIPAGLSDHDMIGCVRKLHNHKFQPRT